MRLSLKRILAGCAFVLAAGPARAAAPPADLPVVQSRDFTATAPGVAGGGRLRLEGVRIADAEETEAFDLERFEVFAQGATITVHGDAGDQVLRAPANAYFRGTIAGKPESRVFLARLEDGGVQGMVSETGGTYLIGAEGQVKALGAPLEMRRVDPVLLKSSRSGDITCGNARLPAGPGNEVLDFEAAPAAPGAPEEKAAARGPHPVYRAARARDRLRVFPDLQQRHGGHQLRRQPGGLRLDRVRRRASDRAGRAVAQPLADQQRSVDAAQHPLQPAGVRQVLEPERDRRAADARPLPERQAERRRHLLGGRALPRHLHHRLRRLLPGSSAPRRLPGGAATATPATSSASSTSTTP